jgi:hypothetical protein
MEVTTDETAKFDSMNAKSHLIGETIDWNPSPQIYMQANANVVYSYISSAYPSSANPSQRNADNNYQTYSLLSGFVLTKTTDAQVEYTYQRANNYDPSIASFTQPYGTAYEESMITVGVKQKLTDRLVADVKVGYMDSRNDTTGGRTNYRGPMAYVALEYGL